MVEMILKGNADLECFVFSLSLLCIVTLLWKEWVERNELPILEFNESGAVILEWTDPLE